MKPALMCIGVLAAAGGCYNSSFVRNDGPVRAGGVAVSLVGQRCDFSLESDAPEETAAQQNRLDLDLQVAIQNGSQDTITFAPQNVRLLIGGAADAPTAAPQPMQVAPGATTKLSVRFEHRGNLGCDASLSLGLEKAVLAGAKAIDLRPVAFVPSPSDS